MRRMMINSTKRSISSEHVEALMTWGRAVAGPRNVNRRIRIEIGLDEHERTFCWFFFERPTGPGDMHPFSETEVAPA